MSAGPILPMRRVEHRLAQSHTAFKWQRQDLEPSPLAPESWFLRRGGCQVLSLLQTPPQLWDRKGLGEGQEGKVRRMTAGSGIGLAPKLPGLEGISTSWVSVSTSAKWGAGKFLLEWGHPEVMAMELLCEMHHGSPPRNSVHACPPIHSPTTTRSISIKLRQTLSLPMQALQLHRTPKDPAAPRRPPLAHSAAAALVPAAPAHPWPAPVSWLLRRPAPPSENPFLTGPSPTARALGFHWCQDPPETDPDRPAQHTGSTRPKLSGDGDNTEADTQRASYSRGHIPQQTQ